MYFLAECVTHHNILTNTKYGKHLWMSSYWSVVKRVLSCPPVVISQGHCEPLPASAPSSAQAESGHHCLAICVILTIFWNYKWILVPFKAVISIVLIQLCGMEWHDVLLSLWSSAHSGAILPLVDTNWNTFGFCKGKYFTRLFVYKAGKISHSHMVIPGVNNR